MQPLPRAIPRPVSWAATLTVCLAAQLFADPSDPETGRSHWAFQRLSPPMVPAVKDSHWPRTTVDRFILNRLEAVRLRPSPEADPFDLVRRVYFDLTGLPPTLVEVERFLADTRPDAWARLVDHLLDSPRFGQRWGRHWLDLARYADSNGLDENFLFREAWRYRNWVIESVNADTPFDRFLTEQIAGDLLPYGSVEQRDRQRIASGFLVMGPKVLLGVDEKRQRMDVADEQLDTIGRAVLAQTLGCARCHNHKFDPIPTADYYAMAGILASTQVMERRHMLNEQRVMERLIGLGAEGESLDTTYETYFRERDPRTKRSRRAKVALELLQKENLAAADDLRATEPDVFAPAAADPALPLTDRIAAQEAMIAELDALLAKPPPIPPRAMACTESDTPADENIRLAGQFDRLGEKVPRGFLRVLDGGPLPESARGHSGRAELAQWLTDTQHGAGQLSARVLANRIWHHLLGRGIVRTTDNFGRTGEPPSHPELLDYLATRLIDSGWSIKAIVRQIVLSRTYAMSSGYQRDGHNTDPDNQLLWRANRRRLNPEALRDAMLMAADQLDLRPMQSTVYYLGDQATAVGKNEVRRRTDFPCRSVYLPVIRNDLPELFEVFDFADPHCATGARPRTNVATQGLFMLNNDLVATAAQTTARRLLDLPDSDPAQRVGMMYRWILTASPSKVQRDALLDYIQSTKARFDQEGGADSELRAWAAACHALFAHSRFQFLD